MGQPSLLDCFFTQNYLISSHDDAVILRDAERIFKANPWIETQITEDLDRAALAHRRKSRQLEREKEAIAMGAPFLEVKPASRAVRERPLGIGRKRTPGLVVFLACILGCSKGSFVYKDFESNIFLQGFLAGHGMSMPERTVLLRLVAKLDESTIGALLKTVVEDCARRCREADIPEEVADVFIDSTACDSASAPLCDESTLAGFVAQTDRDAVQLAKLIGLPYKPLEPALLRQAAAAVLDAGRKASRPVKSEAKTKEKNKLRKDAQKRLLKLADASLAHVNLLADAAQDWFDKNPALSTTHQLHAELVGGLIDAQQIVEVLIDVYKFGPLAAKGEERPLSLSDPDASPILKGQRQMIFGYKPQLACSAHGLILGLTLPHGNEADSEAFTEILRQTHRTLGGIDQLSVDDGYSSAANRAFAFKLGIRVVSFKGAKGKKITPKEEYESEANRELRRRRPCVEGTISSAKRVEGIGQLRTFSRIAAYRELVFKAIAHNLRRTPAIIAAAKLKAHKAFLASCASAGTHA
jgi:hypothetical protein